MNYPNIWFLNAADAASVNITSFSIDKQGHGGIPVGTVTIDIWVATTDVPTVLPTGQNFCVGSECGVRFNQPTNDPAAQGLNRISVVEILHKGRLYGITAFIAEPADYAAENANIFEQLLATFKFTQ